MSNSLQPHGLYSPWNSVGRSTGVGGLSLLQRIFPTQRSNPGLLHCRQILYQLSCQESLVTRNWKLNFNLSEKVKSHFLDSENRWNLVKDLNSHHQRALKLFENSTILELFFFFLTPRILWNIDMFNSEIHIGERGPIKYDIWSIKDLRKSDKSGNIKEIWRHLIFPVSSEEITFNKFNFVKSSIQWRNYLKLL